MSDQLDMLKSRIRKLHDPATVTDGECVVYVMSRDQRAQDNHALIAAQKHALSKQLPLAVVFCLYEKSGYRSREQHDFMLDGLRDVEASLSAKNIPFLLLIGNPHERLTGLLHHTKPDAVYFDYSPLRGSRALKKKLAATHPAIKMFVVDTHNIVPVWQASDKLEVGAYTMRPKLHKQLGQYLIVPEEVQHHPVSWPGEVRPMSELQELIDAVLSKQVMTGVKLQFKSGEQAAHTHLETLKKTIHRYAELRNDPANNVQSDLSPYLHFGHISSLRVVLELQHMLLEQGTDLHLLRSKKMPQAEDAVTDVQAGIDALCEEMIVRKELSDNFCHYQPHYDSVEAAADWAKKTITQHDTDDREHLYSYEELDQAKTHDQAWNAAQIQMKTTGKMHGYMRMYWCKKIKEWTGDAKTAVKFAIQLNDTYSIDGGDPNGYVGILWSIIGVHDRAWTERDIFGKIRYMNYAGLKRKFNIEKYEQMWLPKE